MIDVLETERLILRPIELSDYKDAFKWCGDARVNKFMPWSLYKEAESVKEWLCTVNKKDTMMDYGFVLKSTGELFGSGGIYWHEDEDVWTVGYNIMFDFWNKGYTTEALQKIIAYARSRFNIKTVEGTFALENPGSKKVLEKLGMKFFRDTDYSKFDGSATFKAQTYRMEF